MTKIIIKIWAVLLLTNNVLFAQEEYFVQVNPATCSYTIIDSIPIIKWILSGSSTFDKLNKRYVFIGLNYTQTNRYLCSIDATNGHTVSIPLFAGNFNGLKFDNATGILYGIYNNGSVSSFVSINPATGAYTLIKNLDIASQSGDCTTDDINHRYICSAADNTGTICLYTIDEATGNVISKPPIGNTLSGLKYDNTSGNLYALQWDNSLQKYYFVTVNNVTGNTTIISSISLITGISPDYTTFDEVHKQYTFYGVGTDGGNRYLCTIDATNGQVVYNPLFPSFINPYNLIETEYDNSTGNLYALHWGPIASSGTTPPIPIVTNDTICYNYSATLSATGSGTDTLSWYSAATYGTCLGKGATFTTPVLTSDATYYVQASNSTGGSSCAPVHVKVNPLPHVTAHASATTVCSGTSIILTGSGANLYSWTGGVTNGVAFTASTTNTYTVIGSTGNNCSGSASITIYVNPSPIVTANSSALTVCAGNYVTLTGGGANSYSWTGGVANGVAFVPSTTSTYTVTGTTGNNCSGTASITVYVNSLPLPVVTANSSTGTVCYGNPVVLTGSGANSYLWTGGIIDGVAFTPTSTATYTVEGTDANACTNTATATIIVNDSPTLSITASAKTVCAGTTVTLTGVGANLYHWSGGISDGIGFIPASTTTYTVNGTAANTCSDTATVTIVVNPLTSPVSDISGTTELCDNGGKSYLTVTCSNGTPPYTVIYNINGGVDMKATSATGNNNVLLPVNNKQAGAFVYSVTNLTDVSLCQGPSVQTASYTVTVHQSPTANFTLFPNQTSILKPIVTANDLSTGAIKWLWNFGDTDSTFSSPSLTHTYSDTGTYTIKLIVTGPNYLCKDTVQQTVKIILPTELYIPNSFTPNNDGNNDVFQPKGDGISKYELMIFDRWGNKLFYSNDINMGWDGRVSGSSELSQVGIYVYEINITALANKHDCTYRGVINLMR